jgi:KDO2-lipid IV(A) lauroyltransferase
MSSALKGNALYLILRSFLEVGGRLPQTLTKAIGPRISGAALRLMSSTRRRVLDHLEIAFPDLQDHERRHIMMRCADHFGLMLAETAWLWHANAEGIEAVCEVEGIQHIEKALSEGRGAVFTTAHCGNWEILGSRLPVAGVPLVSAVRGLDNPRLDRLVTSSRTRFGTEIIPRGPAAGRQLIRALTRGKVVCLLIDQDIRDVPGVFVPFFGRPAWSPSGAATLALRLNVPVIPGFSHRRADGSHVIRVHPPLLNPEGGSLDDRVHELTAAATATIERQIRAHPEQWVWMHRRWRRQPSQPEGH